MGRIRRDQRDILKRPAAKATPEFVGPAMAGVFAKAALSVALALGGGASAAGEDAIPAAPSPVVSSVGAFRPGYRPSDIKASAAEFFKNFPDEFPGAAKVRKYPVDQPKATVVLIPWHHREVALPFPESCSDVPSTRKVLEECGVVLGELVKLGITDVHLEGETTASLARQSALSIAEFYKLYHGWAFPPKTSPNIRESKLYSLQAAWKIRDLLLEWRNDNIVKLPADTIAKLETARETFPWGLSAPRTEKGLDDAFNAMKGARKTCLDILALLRAAPEGKAYPGLRARLPELYRILNGFSVWENEIETPAQEGDPLFGPHMPLFFEGKIRLLEGISKSMLDKANGMLAKSGKAPLFPGDDDPSLRVDGQGKRIVTIPYDPLAYVMMEEREDDLLAQVAEPVSIVTFGAKHDFSDACRRKGFALIELVVPSLAKEVMVNVAPPPPGVPIP